MFIDNFNVFFYKFFSVVHFRSIVLKYLALYNLNWKVSNNYSLKIGIFGFSQFYTHTHHSFESVYHVTLADLNSQYSQGWPWTPYKHVLPHLIPVVGGIESGVSFHTLLILPPPVPIIHIFLATCLYSYPQIIAIISFSHLYMLWNSSKFGYQSNTFTEKRWGLHTKWKPREYRAMKIRR